MNSKKLLIIYGYKSEISNDTVYVSEKDFESTVFQKAQYSPLIISQLHKSKLEEKDFLELFAYSNSSLYWLMFPSLWSSIVDSTNFIDRFFEFIKDKHSYSFYLEDDFSKFVLIKQICKKNNIKFSYNRQNFLKFKLRQKFTPFIRKYRLKKITQKKIQTNIDLYDKKFDKIPNLSNKIIFASPDVYRRHLINIKKSITEEGEFFVQDIVDLIDDPDSALGISLDYDVHGNFAKLKRRLNSEIQWIPIEKFLEKYHTNNKQKLFLSNFKKLLFNSNFQSLFLHKDILIWEQIAPTFYQMTFRPYLPLWMSLIDSLEHIFEKNKPSTIFLPYETGPLALCFIIAGKKTNVKTIGIQHGVIADNWKFYSIEPLDSSHHYGFPLPSKLLLFGDYSKNILLKNGYPPEKLISFGNPVFFNLEKKQEILKHMNISKKHGIPDQKIIILFTTLSLQKFRSWAKSNPNTEIWNYLLSHFANDEKYFLIVKPHPDEDPNMYIDIAKNFDAKNILITKESLYELAFISNLVVSMFSTAIIDSLCFQKPVIQVEFDDLKSPIPYGKIGVVIPTNLESLYNSIQQVLSNESLVSNLLTHSTEFLKEIYNIPEDNPEEILKDIFKN